SLICRWPARPTTPIASSLPTPTASRRLAPRSCCGSAPVPSDRKRSRPQPHRDTEELGGGMTSRALLATTDLTKTYGDFMALRQLTLEVRQGEVFGLL